MDLTEHNENGVLLITLNGRLDSNTSPSVEETLGDRARSHPALVLDLTNVQYVSSAGLRVLLKAAKAARAAKNQLALAGMTTQVREVFDISGFTAIFQIFDDATQAGAAVRG